MLTWLIFAGPVTYSRGREEEAVSYWSGKSFYAVWTTLNCVESNSCKSLAIFRELRAHRPYCVKHNQHTKHANARSLGLGVCPPENESFEIEFGAILGSI